MKPKEVLVLLLFLLAAVLCVVAGFVAPARAMLLCLAAGCASLAAGLLWAWP